MSLEKTNSRDAVEAAFEQLSGEEGGDDTEALPEPVEAAPESDAVETEAPAEESQGDEARPSRDRDEGGRFAAKKKAEAEAKAVAKGAKPATEAKVAPVVEVRPPNSLKPTEREAFKSLPVEMQKFIARREVDAAKNHQVLAESAKAGQSWQQVVAPFEQNIRARGGDVRQVTTNLLRTAYVLENGTALQKAETIHNIIAQYADPAVFDMVNEKLQGQPVTQRQQQPQFDQNQMVAQAEQRVMERIERQQQAVMAQRADRDVQTFADSHPYLDEVTDVMVSLMESHSARGLEMSKEKAYALACQSTPEVAALIAKQARANANASPQRVRAAAGSLKTRPAAPAPQQTQDGRRDSRSAVEAAWEQLSR